MISLPSTVKIIEKQENRARFEIGALYPGYGVTVGNSLRRVLLSSLPGAAITEVRIEGVPHEFSTIPGVMEDVLSILMNLKRLNFRIFTEEPQQARLEVTGEKEVTGADFQLPAQVELANPEHKIATLTDSDAELKMEVRIEQGVGYLPRDRRGEEKLAPGVLALDAVFSPVKKVAFDTENVRVEERTDFDKLFLEIETDRTLSPEQALKRASHILGEHFSLFEREMEKEVEKLKEQRKERLKQTEVDDLELSTRTANALKENGVKTLAGILMRKEQTLRELEGIGGKSMEEIREVVEDLGFELKGKG